MGRTDNHRQYEFMTRYIVCIAVIISAAIGVSCSSRDYEYYLDKDTTHPDVYTIKITLTSDGSCDFSINGDRASTYQTFVWTEPEVLQEVKGGSNGSGLCLRDSSKPSSSSGLALSWLQPTWCLFRH